MICLALPFNVVSLILVFILRSAVQLGRPGCFLCIYLFSFPLTMLCQYALGAVFQKL